LAATGLDDATVQQSQASAQQLGKRLDVLTVNEPAKKLFESSGFRASIIEMIYRFEGED